jgi:hypothetical protein
MPVALNIDFLWEIVKQNKYSMHITGKIFLLLSQQQIAVVGGSSEHEIICRNNSTSDTRFCFSRRKFFCYS